MVMIRSVQVNDSPVDIRVVVKLEMTLSFAEHKEHPVMREMVS